ncbi:beta-lactamase-related domain-containing protein [Pseudoscourfieldia marina]
MNHPCPASGMRATAGAVADVMACLARGGAPILKTDTLMMFTRRHRIGMLDELQGVVVDWSLGFAVDSALGGTFASSESYGHGGSQSSYALVDPEHSLSLAFAATNKPGARVHYDRVRRISDAIYKDLRLNATRHARAAPVC